MSQPPCQKQMCHALLSRRQRWEGRNIAYMVEVGRVVMGHCMPKVMSPHALAEQAGMVENMVVEA